MAANIGESSIPRGNKLCIINAPIKGHHVYHTSYPVGTRFSCLKDPRNRHSNTAVVVKKEDTVVGHVPEGLCGALFSILSCFPGVSIDCVSTGVPCGASQGTWTTGGGIEIPGKYIIYGKQEHKKEICLKVKKALSKLQL